MQLAFEVSNGITGEQGRVLGRLKEDTGRGNGKIICARPQVRELESSDTRRTFNYCCMDKLKMDGLYAEVSGHVALAA